MGAAIIEAQAKLRMHRNRALKAFHDANDVRRLAPNGHEISDANAPICCFETGLEDHCIAKIATRFSFDLACGAHTPAAMLLIAEQGRSEEHTSELPSLMRISYAVFCLKNKTFKN